jgi:hypothetical protein
MASNAQTQRGTSWVYRALDKIKPPPAPPHSPSPPPVDRTNWEHSVEAHKINTLTVHHVGLIVFNETRSFTNSDKANDNIGAARENVAHAIMNGDQQLGRHRPATAHPIEPSAKAFKDPKTLAAYESSLRAAREAYLSGTDPTHGATHFKFMTSADRSAQRFNRDSSQKLPVKTQSGPFDNSYLKGGVPSRYVYINTYAAD